ncbi:hypothetical protein D3C86_2188450 [compost metagenome]
MGAGIYAYAAIALFFGIVEVAVVARRVEHIGRHVVGLSFQFLHADEVGVLVGNPVKETFADG